MAYTVRRRKACKKGKAVGISLSEALHEGKHNEFLLFARRSLACSHCEKSSASLCAELLTRWSNYLICFLADRLVAAIPFHY
jgi:hypothetical protein